MAKKKAIKQEQNNRPQGQVRIEDLQNITEIKAAMWDISNEINQRQNILAQLGQQMEKVAKQEQLKQKIQEEEQKRKKS